MFSAVCQGCFRWFLNVLCSRNLNQFLQGENVIFSHVKLDVLKTVFSKHGSRGELMHQECTLKWFERQIKKRKREQSIRRKGLSRAFGSFTLLQSPEKLKSAKGRFFGTHNLWGQMVQSWERQILWLLKGNTSHFRQHQLNSTFAGRVF